MSELILPGTYLVAGATGMMGTYALKRLASVPSAQVVAVAHQRPPRVRARNIRYETADLTQATECEQVTRGIDYMLLFAARLATAPVLARNPMAHLTSNLMINAHLLEAAYLNGVKKVVWMSSSTAYPDQEQPLTEEAMFTGDPPRQHYGLGWMTRYTETLCRMYATQLPRSMAVAVLRPTTLYGEYESFDLKEAHMLPALVRKVVERHHPIEVWGNGEQLRDLLYGDDALDACWLALRQVRDYEVCNIGFGREYSVNEVLRRVLELDDFSEAEIWHNPSGPTSVKRKTLDLSRARTLLKFEPKTPLEEGIRRLLVYYRQSQETQMN